MYADNGSKPVSSRRVASLLLITHRAGMCLEALIRRKKAATDKMIAATTGAPLAPDAEHELTAVAPPPTAEITVLEDEEFELLPVVVPSTPTPFAELAPHAQNLAPVQQPTPLWTRRPATWMPGSRCRLRARVLARHLCLKAGGRVCRVLGHRRDSRAVGWGVGGRASRGFGLERGSTTGAAALARRLRMLLLLRHLGGRHRQGRERSDLLAAPAMQKVEIAGQG